MALYLVPATRSNLEKTIEHELADTAALDLLDPALRVQLHQRSGLEGILPLDLTKPGWT